jgi:N-acetylmuramoyl-L-alanine amidase
MSIGPLVAQTLLLDRVAAVTALPLIVPPLTLTHTLTLPAVVLAQAAVTPPASAATPAVVPRQPSHNLDGGFSIARQLGLGISRIVIDPGHGGRDPGTKGGGIVEAELVLDIALRLEKLLLERQPGIEVVLTRRTDEYVGLQERTAIANRQGADLFLSIHANASNVKDVRGVETYFLNFATNLSAASVAARENAASGQLMGELPDVVKSIALNSKLDESRDFATYLQREMVGKLRPSNKELKDLGVKQAPFVVLIGAAMPSVLAEVSFLTNPQEARLLKGSAYRQSIAEALFEGVRKYQGSLKNTSTLAQQ